MENKTTGKQIKRLRDQKAWTQEHLAEVAKVSVRTVQRAEEGSMSADTLNALASALNVDVQSLSTPPQSEYPDVTPVLYYQHAQTLDWLVQAFGFEIIMRYVGQDGSIQHAELRAGTGRIMVGQPIAARCWTTPELAGVRTQTLYVMLNDIDRHYQRVKKAGATILSEPEDAHGHRRYLSEDPEGHHWWFAAPIA